MDNPCGIHLNVTDILATTTEHDIPFTNNDLVRLFETINNKATTEVNQMRERININVNLMDGHFVIDPEAMIVNDNVKQECNTTAFMVHIDQKLTDLSEHLKYVRLNGDLSVLSSEEEVRESLRTLGNDINSARCNLLTNYDISTNSECVLSSDFVGVDGDFTLELRRVFVVIRDIQRYTTFLIELFQSTSTY